MSKLLKQLKQQLEEKDKALEEKDKEIENLNFALRVEKNYYANSYKQNERLKDKLAKLQNKTFILYSMLYETLEKQSNENIASKIDQMTGLTYDKEADWFKGNRNYDQLKQQLTEYKEMFYATQELKEDCELKILELEKQCANFAQSQNQKAIAELNNILDTFAIFVNEEKESMVSPDGNGNLSLLEYIENRIDTLKGVPKC